MDELNEGEINIDNMRAFLKKNGHYPTEEELVAVIRRLDMDADGSVSYAEMSEAIKPQEFSLMNLYILPPKSECLHQVSPSFNARQLSPLRKPQDNFIVPDKSSSGCPKHDEIVNLELTSSRQVRFQEELKEPPTRFYATQQSPSNCLRLSPLRKAQHHLINYSEPSYQMSHFSTL